MQLYGTKTDKDYPIYFTEAFVYGTVWFWKLTVF